MKISIKNLNPIFSEAHRGGKGLTTFYTCLSPDYPRVEESVTPDDHITWVGMVEVAPGASIKEHVHDRDEEVYIVVSGQGVYSEDGQETPVGERDVLILRRNHSHGMRSTGDAPLVFYAIVAR
jgi:mannose-6-phosphate isomerase-like protein (cupin superfamily)